MAEYTTNNGEDLFTLTFFSETMPFSNWSAHKIKIWDKTFATVEHAFQYRKFINVDPALAKRIKSARSAWEAQRLAKTRRINTVEWDVQREGIMYELLYAKANQHTDVREALMRTGSLAIVQEGDPDDLFWCIGWSSKGKNTLGKLWMKIRADIANN